MEEVKVKVKRLADNAVIPSYAHGSDAGMDVVAASKSVDSYGNTVYGLGFAMEIVGDDDLYGNIQPRSSISKKDLVMANGEAIIDHDYRGEVMLKFVRVKKDNTIKGIREYEIGDKIGQLIIKRRPKIVIEEVAELSETERGSGGFGSTGK